MRARAQRNDTNYQSFPEQEGEETQRQMCEAEYSISTETNLLLGEANTYLGCMICNFVCGNTHFGFAFIYICKGLS